LHIPGLVGQQCGPYVDLWVGVVDNITSTVGIKVQLETQDITTGWNIDPVDLKPHPLVLIGGCQHSTDRHNL
jgi:hypothetical protein